MKNKLKLIIYLLFIFTIHHSCKQKESKELPDQFLHISIPVGDIQQIKLSEIISDFKAVKLEFTENSMLHSVRKVLFFNDFLYVLDTFGAKGVLVFDMEGNFIRKIGTSGRGPGQYTLPQDFLIDREKKEIEILANRKIYYYSASGEYIRHLNLPFTGINFIKDNNEYFFAITGKEDYKVVKTNLKGKLKNKYLPTHKNYDRGVAFCCFIPQVNGQLLYRPIRRDTIFALQNNVATPYRIFDFGEYKFNVEEFYALPPLEQMKYMKYNRNDNQCIVRNYFENSKYIHLCYNMSGNFYEYVLNKQTGSYVHFGNESLTDDVIGQKDSRWMTGGDDEYVYYVIEPYKFESSKQLREFYEKFTNDEKYIQEMLVETSNPIILLAKYKI